MAESSEKYENAKLYADMLRNTPSNIRRLTDEIEQCEGRQKYLAQTRSPSDGGDVRWYFSKVPMAENELAAAFPRAEVVGKGDYFRFGMRDSLAIEASFLQREEELLSNWWGEYGECSEGPKGSVPSTSKSEPAVKPYNLPSTQSEQRYADEDERVGVPVKGGLYEVDLVRRHSFPVYWNGDNRRVLRGHWFARKGSLDWLPLREDVAEQLEFAYRSRVWHRRTFQPSGLFAARVDMQGSSPGLHALFTGEDDTWDAWLNVGASGFASIVNFGGTGIKLRRGYAPSLSEKPTQDELRQQKEEEMDDYCSQVPVRHLVFMVHGIGQRLEKANLVDDVGTFRHVTESLADLHLTSYQRGTQRVLFIPCQWRKDLKLSGESAVEKCTLPGVRGLRVTLSATVHDVLYYMSPIYCQDIINSVSNQLNRLYLKFLMRNPGYDGKVSLYGHSLGSVLSYDILCHQENLSSPFQTQWMFKEPNHKISPECESSMSSGNTDLTTHKDPPLKDITNAHSEAILPETYSEESGSPLTQASVSDENLSVESDSKKRDSPALDEVGVKSSDNPIEMQSEEKNGLDECTSINGEVLTSNSNGIDEEIIKNDENILIKSLKEEIDFLNARIKELESHRAEANEQEASIATTGSVSKSSPSLNNDTPESYTPYIIKYTKLEFKVDTFFAVGSPLGVFLALRNIRIGIGKGNDYWDNKNIIEEMPSCRQMFNIFHPYDPVAYRIEPLVCKEYIDKRPVIIPYHRGGKRLHVGYQEFVEKVALRSQVVVDHMSLVKVKVLTVCQSRDSDDDHEETSEQPEEIERSYGSIMLERITGSRDGRIDHVLQNKTFEHQYISAVSAHTKYWRDPDTALFILKHLYRDIPNEPGFPNKPTENDTNQENDEWDKLFDDEELPLTFADEKFLKQFSIRAKKFTKDK
ncbi:phospholipase SGR2-like isoform X2 [Cynara cardunculus var. scolymus]|uniref:phospholipase SGR2-like isoform X2 n=1 Tax=Cynara cardunculus var. scolymus TaxID=59895 RepID=UPI000D6262DD|nr:phospholipase SGR2-like isoform X2 [Cynara cardunculus var. scolymus]